MPPSRFPWDKRPRTPLPPRKAPLRPISARRAEARADAEPLVQAVYRRDGGCVLRLHTVVAGGCWGGLSPHHVRKAGQGGEFSQLNIVSACCGHNGWVERNRRLAWALGLVLNHGEDIEDAWGRMRAAGLAVGDPT